MPTTRSRQKAGLALPSAGIKRKHVASPIAANQSNKKAKTLARQIASVLHENTLHTPARELKEILANLGIKNNSDISAKVYGTTIRNVDAYSLTLQMGGWLTDPILQYAREHLQAQFDPKEDFIFIPSPAECHHIRSLGQQQNPSLTATDRAPYEHKRFLFLTVNDAELDQQGGSHWSLLVVDVASRIARHYNSLPELEALEVVARDVAIGIGYLLQTKLAYGPDTQTPHQDADNLAKGDFEPCGPFVFFMMRTFLGMIFEPDRQPKSDVRLQLPRGDKIKFDSMRKRVDIIKSLVQCRTKSKDSNNNGRNSDGKGHGGYGEADPEIGSIEYDNGNDDDSALENGVYDGQCEDDSDFGNDDIDFRSDDKSMHEDDDHDESMSEYGERDEKGEEMAARLRSFGFGEEELDEDDQVEDDAAWDGMEEDLAAFDPPQNHASVGKNPVSDTADDGEKTKRPRVKVFFDKDRNSAADLIDSLDPDGHLAILSNLLRTLENPKTFFDEPLLKYDRFVEGMGREVIEAAILRALEEDLQKVFDSLDVRPETLRKCDTKKAHACEQAGVYLHVIYDPNEPDLLGLYVGSAVNVARRIHEHIRDRWLEKYANNAHNEFWNQKDRQDFWLLLGGFKGESYEPGTEAILLNILEMLGVLLARSMKPGPLKGYLPKNASVYSHSGATPLNTTLPLNQWRRDIGETFMRKAALRVRRKARSFWRSRNHGYGEKMKALIRVADPSRGERTTIEVVCNRCRNPFSVKVDKRPMYEKKNGKYVAPMKYCRCCLTIGKSRFVPVDTSIAWRGSGSVGYETRWAPVREPGWAESIQELWRNRTLNIRGLRREELIAAIMAEGVTLGRGQTRPRVPELREQLEALLTEKEDLRKRAEAGLATNEDLMKLQQIESRVPKYPRKRETRAGPDSAKVKPFDGKLRTPKLLPPAEVERLWRCDELKLNELPQIQIIKQIRCRGVAVALDYNRLGLKKTLEELLRARVPEVKETLPKITGSHPISTSELGKRWECKNIELSQLSSTQMRKHIRALGGAEKKDRMHKAQLQQQLEALLRGTDSKEVQRKRKTQAYTKAREEKGTSRPRTEALVRAEISKAQTEALLRAEKSDAQTAVNLWIEGMEEPWRHGELDKLTITQMTKAVKSKGILMARNPSKASLLQQLEAIFAEKYGEAIPQRSKAPDESEADLWVEGMEEPWRRRELDKLTFEEIKKRLRTLGIKRSWGSKGKKASALQELGAIFGKKYGAVIPQNSKTRPK